MEHEWDDFLSDSMEANEVFAIEKELEAAIAVQVESSGQNAAGGFSRVDWEDVIHPEGQGKMENTGIDDQGQSFSWEEERMLEERLADQNAARDISKPMFSWDGSNKSEEIPKRRNRKRSFQKDKILRSGEMAANRNSVKSKEIPVIEIDDDIPKKEPEESKVNLHHTLTIQGIKVMMPVKPYQCQVQVMTSIISGCQKEQNCLLESPTGSGKTLALLCAALAWQSNYQSKFSEPKMLERSWQEAGTSKFAQSGIAGCGQSAGKCCEVDESDLMMFDTSDWGEDDVSDYYNCSTDIKRVPKIYYGSRTHRQLSQVVKELKKTMYRDKRMTVLSSRDFSCIQETNKNKTELCAELLDPMKRTGCPYYNEHNKLTLGTYSGLQQRGVESPWDIEDLVTVGREEGACPYFAARNLMLEAEIIFCPYNYLIDPAIRDTLQLEVQGNIIILDEAHNMEDICRDAGSVSLTDSLLENIVEDCVDVLNFATAKKIIHEAAYAAMIESYCQSLRKFIGSTKLNEQKGAYDTASSNQWTGPELITIFDINQISQSTTKNFISSAREGIALFNSSREELRQGKPSKLPTLSTNTIRKLEMILMALNMITSPQHASDYRAVIKLVTIGYKKERSLEFLCMNPGVIFSPLSAKARTIILASGTLAPTSSFAGELGVKFPFMIQANHVTPPSQICIKCVGKGPKGKALKATYQNVNTWDFQDEVGSILVSVCEAVPHGVLIFFSSYGVMNTLVARWQSNNVMNRIAAIKDIFQETRGSSDLTSMMTNYRESIQNTSNGTVGKLDGAVLFAVFRGKVAEGIDFSDNEARAVITIGIPFAVRNDPAIDMKYRYNDANRSKGLLSGNDWYTIQAFRALNQALGRAIRHQNDWGAIILIDERLTEFRYMNFLPAWVRKVWIQPTGPQPEMSAYLREFVAKQKKRDRENNLKST